MKAAIITKDYCAVCANGQLSFHMDGKKGEIYVHVGNWVNVTWSPVFTFTPKDGADYAGWHKRVAIRVVNASTLVTFMSGDVFSVQADADVFYLTADGRIEEL